MTVAELLHRISPLELADWQDFFAAESKLEAMVAAKVKPDIAAQMVWRGPEQRAEADEDEEEDE